MSKSLHRMVVVGGGAGGLELVTRLARGLGRWKKIHPILVDMSPTHVWKPLLHEVATGALNIGEDELNYFSHGYRCGYDFRIGYMDGLDRSRKVIHIRPVKDYEGREIIARRTIKYDTLILAVGSVSNSFGTKGVEKYCVALDRPHQAEYLRRRILGQAISVMMGTAGTKKLRIGIVGAGATGVELASEIHHTITTMHNYGAHLTPDQLDITILEGGPRILGPSPQSLADYAMKELQRRNIEVRLNCMIKGVTEKGFVLGDGSLLEKEIKVWAAGVKAPDWLKKTGLQITNFNNIKVNEHLQTLDDPSIYAIGDCACSPIPEDPQRCLPATAQVAHQQAEWLVKQLKAHLKGKKVDPFAFSSKGMLVSLGKGKGVGSVAGPKGDHYVEGWGAKLIYSSLYRMHQAALHGVVRTALLIVGDKLRKAAVPSVKFH